MTTVTQGRIDWRDLGGWLSASVTQHGKAQYCRDLARNVARGLRKVKLDGRWFGIAPLGYHIVDGKLELGDDAEVAAVQRIFDMRVEGQGYYVISKALNAAGVPTPRGTRWQANSVRQVLNRETYLGHTIVGKHSRSKYGRVVDEPVTLENTHQPIIDQKTWDAVRAVKSKQRRSHTRNGSNGAPLAGLCYCGRCGTAMYAVSGNLYVCGSYHTRGRCGYCNVKRGPLLSAVAAKIREALLMGSPKRLEVAIQRELERRAAKQPRGGDTRRKLEHLDAQVERAVDRLLVVDASLVDDLQRRLLALKGRREKLAAAIDDTPSSRPLMSAKAIAAKAWELDRILATASPEVVRNALSQVVERITLDFEPGKETRCRRPYRFTGGRISFRTNEVTPAAR